MSQVHWQRRSSSLRRPSQDPSKQSGHASRFVDRSSRIPLPRSSSQPPAPIKEPPGFKRSKSTLGPTCTPQEKLISSGKITPQGFNFTPKFYGSYSSKKSNFHKDVQDKEFQREAFHMVSSYIQNNYSSSLNIRPMTIKLFIEIVNLLMGKLGIYNKDELVQFTPLNYEKDLPHWMRLLEYPTSTSSHGWLKTVNVPQCWPSVIGLLSWMVSLVQVSTIYDLDSQLMEGLDEDKNKLFNVNYFTGCLEVINLTTEDDDDYDIKFRQICQKVVQFSEQIRGLTDDVFDELQAENDQLRKQADDPDAKAEQDMLDELEQRLTVTRSLCLKQVEDMELKAECIDNIKANASKKERNVESLKNETERIRQEVERLKVTVTSQPMSITEFTEIKKKCDYLLKEISYTEKECEDNLKLVSRYEHDINTMRDKILQNASTFNRHVIQLEQQVPELQGLRARVNPESADVVQQLEHLVKALEELKTRLVGQLEELEACCRETQLRIDSLKQRLRDATSSELQLRQRVGAKTKEIQQLQAEFTEKESSFKLEVEELEKRLLVFQQKQKENDSLKEKAIAMEKRLELVEKCKKKMAQMESEMWMKMEERAEFFKNEIAQLQDRIVSHEKDMEKHIDELVAELRK